MENKEEITYKLHLYAVNEDLDNMWMFPRFPHNSYETTDKNKIIEQLNDLFNNHKSGITKIVIETSEFGKKANIKIADPQNIINLDR